MELRQAAQVIRDSVTMNQILDLYGYKPRHGFMCCPFHGEKEPSLKIYGGGKGWHCFGCGRGGSVIDFVMEQEGCNFRTAVIAIEKAIGMNLTDPHEDVFRATEERRKQVWLDQFVEDINACLNALENCIEREQQTRLAMVKILEEKRDRDIQSVSSEEWNEMLCWKMDDEYDEYRKERIESFREEVAAWRRDKRRMKT